MPAKELHEILNWRRLNNNITLSGQPTETQLAELKDVGITHIVNLGPQTNKGALDDEAGTVEALGMSYVYIPVDFENPTTADYTAFCHAIESLENDRIHVHCIYNARVTAFFYRYACDGKGGPVTEAHTLMDGIWRPGGVWAKFIGNESASEHPNLYKGYDY